MAIKTDVLVVGGGFGGVAAAQALQKQGINTILVDKKDYFEVTFATLRNVCAPEKTGNRARKYYKDFLTGKFIQSTVEEMSATSARLKDGTEIQFNSGIIASGTRYPSLPLAKSETAMDFQSRNQELVNTYEQLRQAKKVMVIGGGVVGVELAGEIAYAMPDTQLILAHKSDTLLDTFKPKAQQRAERVINATPLWLWCLLARNRDWPSSPLQ